MRAFLLLGDIFIHAVAENVSSIVATWEGRYILDFSSIFHRFLFNTKITLQKLDISAAINHLLDPSSSSYVGVNILVINKKLFSDSKKLKRHFQLRNLIKNYSTACAWWLDGYNSVQNNHSQNV